MTSTPLAQLSDIHVGYGRRTVVRGLSLRVDAGDRVALLGPNGAGKTTMLKVLVGLLRPRSGTVVAPTGRGIGWVPQGGGTWQRLTVRENLELFARLLRIEQPGMAAQRAIDAADMRAWTNHVASSLSGGLRQRLNVAVGLLGEPHLLVLDEPTTGIDLEHRVAMFDVLRERADDGCAVLVSTHALEDAEAIASRAVVMVAGSVVYDDSIDALAAVPGIEHAPQLPDPRARGLLQLWRDAAGDGAATAAAVGAPAAGTER